MSEREELAKWCDDMAEGTKAAVFTLDTFERIAALLRQPAAPVQVSEAMVERARKAHILLLRDRDTFDTPIGKAQVHDFRDAMQVALEAALQAGVPAHVTLADPERIKEWWFSKPRKDAVTAFTAGPERQIAYLMEQAFIDGRASVPSGWKMVPRVATPEMCIAGATADGGDDPMQSAWEAMYDSAPTAAQEDK